MRVSSPFTIFLTPLVEYLGPVASGIALQQKPLLTLIVVLGSLLPRLFLQPSTIPVVCLGPLSIHEVEWVASKQVLVTGEFDLLVSEAQAQLRQVLGGLGPGSGGGGVVPCLLQLGSLEGLLC